MSEKDDVSMEKLQAMLARRDELEQEIRRLSDLLLGPGGYQIHQRFFKLILLTRLGFSGGLIDQEGFPIGDVEKIIETTTARNQLSSP